MGTLLHSCVKMHKAIELPLMVISVVGPGIGALDWGSGPPRVRGGLGSFSGS